MALPVRPTSILALAVAALLAGLSGAGAEDKQQSPCNEDAMLVFDASGSMAGNLNQGIATTIPRINEVREALAEVLPTITRFRRVGLITYGPGPYQQCNVQLALKPTPDAAGLIMQEVNVLSPAGKTPLTAAVKQAAEVLDYRNKPGLIVVLTDGEETCGGSPCELGKELHAGALQLTAWKARQLACCRETPGPGRTLPANAGTAWRHGLRLGLHCSRCCAGLMAILLVIGVMDLRAMAVVAAAITVERLAPAGERVARATGVVFIGAGLFLIARAAGHG